jgi:tetratricopeptide (TPR) repeat protein
MRPTKLPYLLLLLLLTICFCFGSGLDARFQSRQDTHSGDVMALLLGDSRRMFANHFFVKADAYFHSGFYPSIFDNQESFKTAHIAEDSGAMKGKNQGDEAGFMGPPLDFIDAFERSFIPSRHTHLDEGGAQGTNSEIATLNGEKGGAVREILPWLKLSAELDPSRIETYTVAAYWLRSRMGKVDEAEHFLREGLRANPRNAAILFELGRIYNEDRQDYDHARNVWELGVAKLDAQKQPLNEQDEFILVQLTIGLARLEEKQGNDARELEWLERNLKISPEPDVIQKQIDELKLKLKSGAAVSPPAATAK